MNQPSDPNPTPISDQSNPQTTPSPSPLLRTVSRIREAQDRHATGQSDGGSTGRSDGPGGDKLMRSDEP